MKTARRGEYHFTICALLLLSLTACGGGGGGGGGNRDTYTIGGTVTGLTGSGLVLENVEFEGLYATQHLAISANGPFTFAPAVAHTGNDFVVHVQTQPSSPSQTCVVSNGLGEVHGRNVTDVSVACTTTTTYTIGGRVTGLTGSGLVLQDNASSDLAVSAAGAFTFATRLATGAAYAVTVKTQPSSPTQNCVVTAGSGTVATSNVTNVAVACTTTTTHTIGGIVFDLIGSGLVLQNNGGDDLSISTRGSFTFTTAVPGGAAYAVTVKTQPNAPAQTCSVGSGTGTIGAENVADIRIACALHFAYAANAGDNTLSEYTIDSFTGTLTAVGTPVATGASPYAITGSPDGRHVYVVNQASNDISAYVANATSGVLTPISGSPFAAGTDPQALAFDPSGAHLYVANKGSNNLSAYAVNASTGALTPLSTATYATGTGPSAVSIDGSGKFVFVANNGGSNNISVFAITAGTGALTPVAGSPFGAGGSPHSLALTLVGPFDYSAELLYTANSNGTSSTISGFSVDISTGSLTALTGSPFALAVSNYIGIYSGYGDSLFVTTGDRVVGYLNLPALTAIASYSAATGINAYSVTVDQLHGRLYVTNYGAASVSGYEIDDVGGTLTALPGSPFPAGNNPVFMAIL